MSKGEAALKGVKGVQEATINLATSAATVTLAGENMPAWMTENITFITTLSTLRLCARRSMLPLFALFSIQSALHMLSL